MPSSPKHRKTDKATTIALIGAGGVVLAALIGAVASVWGGYLARGSSVRPVSVMPAGQTSSVAPTPNRSPGPASVVAVPSSSSSPQVRSPSPQAGTPSVPQPKNIIVLHGRQTPVIVLPMGHRASPSASTKPTQTPGAQHVLNVRLAVTVDSISDISGVYVAPLSLIWTANVAVDGQAVIYGCRIIWNLYDGSTLVYEGASSCNGTFELPLLLNLGVYKLVGQATLASGEQVQNAIPLQVTQTSLKSPIVLSGARDDVPIIPD
jgi:hypothetical protein